MHDMRKRALKQSGKTVSRRARARLDPLHAPGSASPASSAARSRSVSRYSSRPSSRIPSPQGSRYASEDESVVSGSNYSGMEQLALEDDEAEGGSESDFVLPYNTEPVEESEPVHHHTPEDTFQACIDVLQDRKRSSYEARINALATFLQLLQDHYMGASMADAVPTVLDLLLRSIRRSNADVEEQTLALQALAVTTLSCPKEDSADILDSAFGTVKAVCKAADADDKSKVAAIETLTVVVLFGGGTKASADELFKFLLDIVTSDGQTVEALDSSEVVTAAVRMWAFVASYMTPEDEGDDDGSSEEEPPSDILDNSLVTESQTALEAFVDQLQSTETEVQIAASEAIGLLFEMSRKYEAATGEQLDLRENPVKLAEQLKQITRGIHPDNRSNAKSASRLDRRNLREAFSSVATSLELGTGPKYSTAARTEQTVYRNRAGAHMDDGDEDTTGGAAEAPDTFGYRMRLQIQDRSVVIDSWALGTRVDTLRTILGRGMHRHLLENPLVGELLHATGLKPLQRSVEREQKKKSKRGKVARRKG